MEGRVRTPVGPNVSNLLLVEGVPGLGKSTLLDQLLRRHVAGAAPRRLRTVLHLTQAHTYGPLASDEDAGTLTRQASFDHLQRIVTALAWLTQSLQNESKPKCFVVIDCLHLTACLRPGVVQWSDVESLDHELAAIGCRLLLLDATDETVRNRTVVARMNTQFIQGYALGRHGTNEGELIRHFQHERNIFRDLFAASRMAKLQLRAEATIAENVSAAFEFWVGHVSST